jgi:STE24 endopeptidase
MKTLLLLLYLLTLAAGLLLRSLNLRHLKRHGHRIPPGFEGAIAPEVLRRTTDYTLAQSRAVLAESLFGGVVLILFLFAGGLPLYDRWIGSLTASFIGGGVLFFFGLHLAQTVLDIPFSLYRNFRIEKRFGFNTMTIRLWLSDLVKSAAVSTALLAVLVAGASGQRPTQIKYPNR